MVVKIPQTPLQAKVFILSHADEIELKQYQTDSDLLEHSINVVLGIKEDKEAGKRWVYCKKHKLTTTAMKFGADDRCGKCVQEKLTKASEGMKPAPMNTPDLSDLYSMNFDILDKTKE